MRVAIMDEFTVVVEESFSEEGSYIGDVFLTKDFNLEVWEDIEIEPLDGGFCETEVEDVAVTFFIDKDYLSNLCDSINRV